MTKLSVNINKIATIRNARGGNTPNVLQSALDIVQFGGQGITVHPRPDQRHIRYSDVYDLSKALDVEFNIEGYPSDDFIKLVTDVKPAQVTLVPDAPDVLTSNAGWDTIKNYDFLKEIVAEFKQNQIRTSLFIETKLDLIENAAKINTDRIELYTESYAQLFPKDKETAVAPFIKSAEFAKSLGLDINAGHDLSLGNLTYFIAQIPFIKEVSIGHALISDALYFGLHNTVELYLNKIALGQEMATKK